MDVAVCGLAKRLEEVWLPGEDGPVILPRSSEGLYLLQRVRDEAHRFAITYHRAKRAAALTASELDAVPGLGPARRATLLRQFGSVRKLGAATVAGDRRGCRDSAADRGVGVPGPAMQRESAGGAGRTQSGGPSMSTEDDGAAERGQQEIVIITGLSGAGRSTAAKSLEDLDWFVADNLPADLLPTMADLARRARGAVPRLAAVVDIRSRAFSTDLKSAISDLNARGVRPYVVFLEASDETLVRRFDSVSRPHPLQEGGRVVDGIAAERELLQGMRAEADLVLDTTGLNVHELRVPDAGRVRHRGGHRAAGQRRVVRLQVRPAGGRRHGGGLPVPAEPALGTRAGAADRPGPPVIDYVLGQPGAPDFLDAFVRAVEIALAGYDRTGRHFVLLAVGCTGGKHRSVVMADEMAARLSRAWPGIQVTHRDLGRE